MNTNTVIHATKTNLKQKLIEFITKENTSHQIVIWSKSYCPHCNATKELLKSLPSHVVADVIIHELDVIEHGSLIQYYLKSMTGSRTVPVVFVNNQFIGGNSDVHNLDKEGRLVELLREEAPGMPTGAANTNATSTQMPPRNDALSAQ